MGDVLKPAWIVRLRLHGLERGFRKWVVVGDTRPTDAALDAERRQPIGRGRRQLRVLPWRSGDVACEARCRRARLQPGP
jgi:hypothetical protein